MSQATYTPSDTLPVYPASERPLTLEGVLWDALDRIAGREGHTVLSLVTEIDRRRGRHSLQSALRTVALGYLRMATAREHQPAILDTVLGQLNPS